MLHGQHTTHQQMSRNYLCTKPMPHFPAIQTFLLSTALTKQLAPHRIQMLHPHSIRTLSALFPHSIRTLSALYPRYFRTLLPSHPTAPCTLLKEKQGISSVLWPKEGISSVLWPLGSSPGDAFVIVLVKSRCCSSSTTSILIGYRVVLVDH